ncbi:lipoprotein, partial [Mycoplasma capricolum]|uniref:lipoprotein n=1 Tax=Mycoplasma capricolum TaxID=2095 RepID=UPI000629EF45
MKKILILLGSIDMAISTAAVAIACENKVPATSLSKDKITGVKEKSEDKPREKLSEGTESATHLDQPSLDESAKEAEKKEIDKAEQSVK